MHIHSWLLSDHLFQVRSRLILRLSSPIRLWHAAWGAEQGQQVSRECAPVPGGLCGGWVLAPESGGHGEDLV
eukprot:9843732-Prorocentrum_lima.AAC.1